MNGDGRKEFVFFFINSNSFCINLSRQQPIFGCCCSWFYFFCRCILSRTHESTSCFVQRFITSCIHFTNRNMSILLLLHFDNLIFRKILLGKVKTDWIFNVRKMFTPNTDCSTAANELWKMKMKMKKKKTKKKDVIYT